MLIDIAIDTNTFVNTWPVWGAKPSLSRRRLRQDTGTHRHPKGCLFLCPKGGTEFTMGDITDAATSGNRLNTLVALRDRLAADIEAATTARDVSMLTKELTNVLREIDAIPTADSESKVDEIAKRRAERQAAVGQ